MQKIFSTAMARWMLAPALCATLTVAVARTDAAQQNRPRQVVLEEGTVLPVLLETPLSSNKSRKGDRFTAVIRTSERTTYLGLPQGTRLEGVVVEATPRRDSKTPGILDIEFQRLRMPNGDSYEITTSLIPLDEKSVETQEDGRIVARPGRKREQWKYVGYGAAAGALFSILGNRGRITIENLLLGGLAGLGAGQILRGPQEARDVQLKPGTEIGLRLEKPLRFRPLNEDEIPDEDRAPLAPGKEGSDVDFGVMVRERNVVFGTRNRPFRAGDTWMLPVRPMLDAMSYQSRYAESTRTLQVTDGNYRVRATVGSRIVVLGDGSRRQMSRPLQLINGELVAPAQFFEIVSRMKARYDEASNTLVFDAD